jgi:hypothetical protein
MDGEILVPATLLIQSYSPGTARPPGATVGVISRVGRFWRTPSPTSGSTFERAAASKLLPRIQHLHHHGYSNFATAFRFQADRSLTS